MTTRLPDPERSNALLIGTAHFTSEAISDLPSVTNNVSALAEALTDPVAGVIERTRCQRLINPRAQHEVGAALDEAVNAADDTLIVYYAGHGFLTPRGALHLAVADTDPAAVAYTAVPIEWLRIALAESPAKNRILILDCCFSGHATSAMASVPSAVTAAIDISGTYTLTSSPANSTSIAPPGERFTAFTKELINILHDGIPGAGDLLSLRDIYIALVRSLHSRSMPRPQHLGTGLADHIALGPNPASRNAKPVVRTDAPAAAEVPQVAPPADIEKIEKEFHQALVSGYLAMKRQINYNATIYIRMISNLGAVGAARQLLHASSVSSGFTTLWEKGRLDLTVEAFVLREPWSVLFSEDELQIARDRLAAYGYHPN
ncbi:caspase family protein [Micromonospora sp. NBC_01813]|uniref:caspase family protein n=1 Tax=Micromonospora sp. NBC_01813 TaxID=2975988 RepID=UPI002DDB9302|nr:caspase family protein [Micromonospora sp. NBC_01813]WSA11309.1 caspase family protein [Micromonospora sp. NBC_01813]